MTPVKTHFIYGLDEHSDRIEYAIELPNGSYYDDFGSVKVTDSEGNVHFEGKRIYTIDEANLVAKPTGNTIRIKYR